MILLLALKNLPTILLKTTCRVSKRNQNLKLLKYCKQYTYVLSLRQKIDLKPQNKFPKYFITWNVSYLTAIKFQRSILTSSNLLQTILYFFPKFARCQPNRSPQSFFFILSEHRYRMPMSMSQRASNILCICQSSYLWFVSIAESPLISSYTPKWR